MKSLNSFNTCKNITIDNKNYKYFDLNILASTYSFNLSKIPNSIKVILENLIRNEDGESVTKEMISNLCKKINQTKENIEILFSPARVLMQDFTGVPAIADLAAMRDALKNKGINPNKINPVIRYIRVIFFGFKFNSSKELQDSIGMFLTAKIDISNFTYLIKISKNTVK